MGDGHSKSLMGVIADCLRSQSCHAMTIGDKKAGDIMTSPVITVREHAVLSEITKLLTENNINRVPVVDEKGCIVGIISRGDIVRASLGNQIESSKAG
jgi:CBS domain-containing protein